MEQLDTNIFYTVDKAIRTYRQYAQKQLKKAGFTITIDQWLIIRTIQETPDITQSELGEKVFKDNASVTRIIALLVRAKYLKRKVHGGDRRRTSLTVTPAGEKVIRDVQKVVLQNRSRALQGIPKAHIGMLLTTLQTITRNCSD